MSNRMAYMQNISKQTGTSREHRDKTYTSVMCRDCAHCSHCVRVDVSLSTIIEWLMYHDATFAGHFVSAGAGDACHCANHVPAGMDGMEVRLKTCCVSLMV